MPPRLLDRQIRLLDHLTSGAAIFGDRPGAPVSPALRGVDLRLLRVEAHVSHEKRMEKIVAVLPRTLALLGGRRDAVVRDFVDACPPADISRLVNARQFRDFLLGRRADRALTPRYAADVAACEVAIAEARSFVPEKTRARVGLRRDSIRRRPGTVLLRSDYDIRAMFERGDAAAAQPRRGATLLAVAVPPRGREPRVFALAPDVFALLGALDAWTDRAAFGNSAHARAMIASLRDARLIEASIARTASGTLRRRRSRPESGAARRR
jgi:hypothetical protein